jgi:hypothetical protein
MPWHAMPRREPLKMTVKVFDNSERMIYLDRSLDGTNPGKDVSSLMH